MEIIDSTTIIRRCNGEGIYDLCDILESLLQEHEDQPISFDYCGVSVTCQPSKGDIKTSMEMWSVDFCSQAFKERHRPNDSWWFFIGLIEHRHRWGVTYTTAANEVIGLVAREFGMSQSDVFIMIDRQLQHRWLRPRSADSPGQLQSWYEELVRWNKNRKQQFAACDQNRQFC